MQQFLLLAKRIKRVAPSLNFGEVVAIIKLICEFGQPLLKEICPLVNSGHDKVLLAELESMPSNFSPEG